MLLALRTRDQSLLLSTLIVAFYLYVYLDSIHGHLVVVRIPHIVAPIIHELDRTRSPRRP